MNGQTDPKTPTITIVVSPRERFSYTQQSLESIYAHTDLPFSLIYVDGGSPTPVQQYLQQQSSQKGFKLIRTDEYLAPNRARNKALRRVKSDYVVFIDNDVEVTPGWLGHLVRCAEETGATVVSPLTCIGQPVHQKIHLAGGEAHIKIEVSGDQITRRVHEKHYFVNRPVADVSDRLHRRQCEFAEFHCMLVRTDIFDKIGPLDKNLLNTREHIDFCMTVTQAGGTIYCEPTSIVTYVPGPPFDWSDIPFFMLRWSDAWEESSLKHFRRKWELTVKDKYFKKRYRRLGQRRHQAFLRPLVRQFTLGRKAPWLENMVIPLERMLNRYITDRYEQQQAARKAAKQQQASSEPSLAASSSSQNTALDRKLEQVGRGK
jgi:GT2 family glycosyltransferase